MKLPHLLSPPYSRFLGLSVLGGAVALAAWSHDPLLLAGTLLVAGISVWTISARARRLEQRERGIQQLLQRGPIPAALTRFSDGTILQVNDALLVLTGYSREQIIGRTTVEIGLWSSREERNEAMAMLLRESVVRGRDASFRRESGESVQALFSAQLIEIKREQCVFMVMQDITASKQAGTLPGNLLFDQTFQ